MHLVLASCSSWRRELFKVYLPHLYKSEGESFAAPDIDEKAVPRKDGDSAEDISLRIAKAKMDVFSANFSSKEDDDIVVTMDQVRDIPEWLERPYLVYL